MSPGAPDEPPEVRAARYPFAQPDGSYVHTRTGDLPLVDPTAPWGPGTLLRDGGRTTTWSALRGAVGAPDGPRHAVLGYGSNPAPETLARKFRVLPERGVAVPVLALAVHGLDAVWSAHVHAGYVPATIAPSPGTVLRAWALLLTDEELRVVNASESLGRNYALGRLRGARATWADGTACRDLRTYVSLHGALTDAGAPVAVGPVPADGRRLRALGEPDVLRLVHGRTADGAPRDAFLRAIAVDPAAATTCTERLRADAQPFAWPGWEQLEPAPP